MNEEKKTYHPFISRGSLFEKKQLSKMNLFLLILRDQNSIKTYFINLKS
jgi:hypothetical protein